MTGGRLLFLSMWILLPPLHIKKQMTYSFPFLHRWLHEFDHLHRSKHLSFSTYLRDEVPQRPKQIQFRCAHRVVPRRKYPNRLVQEKCRTESLLDIGLLLHKLLHRAATFASCFPRRRHPAAAFPKASGALAPRHTSPNCKGLVGAVIRGRGSPCGFIFWCCCGSWGA